MIAGDIDPKELWIGGNLASLLGDWGANVFPGTKAAVAALKETIKNPAASGRGIEADLLPNPRFGLQALELRRRAAGNMSPTRFKVCRSEIP